MFIEGKATTRNVVIMSYLTLGVFEIVSNSEIVIAFWLPLSLNMPYYLIMMRCCLFHVIDWINWEVFPELTIQIEGKNWESRCFYFFLSFLDFSCLF